MDQADTETLRPPSTAASAERASIAAMIARARAAQACFAGADQERVDEAVTGLAWALYEPGRARALAELAVADTGLGNVADKIIKKQRKTFGTLRDLLRVRSVGVIEEDAAHGLVKFAKPVGVVGAVTPSTNPGATPVNKSMMAIKGRNAIIIAPSPAGWTTTARAVDYMRAELGRIGLPEDLVQILPQPVTKGLTQALMEQVDLVVVTGSQDNVRRAYASGTPAIGVGAGNVPVIVDASAELDRAAELIAASKTFDNATSCSSENSLVLAIYRAADFDAAVRRVREILAWQGAGHSCGIHTRDAAHARRLAEEMDVVRVLVNQAHAFGNGGSFDNGLNFTLSMGCGTWGRNSISENLNYRHFLNVTHLVTTIPPDQPSEEELFGAYLARHGRGTSQ